MRIMKKVNLLLLSLIVLTVGLSAQVKGNRDYNSPSLINDNTSSGTIFSSQPPGKAAKPDNNEILVEINGLMNIAADNYVAVFNLVQVGETMEDVDDIMQNRINTFKEKLYKLGISEKEIKTDLISFVPRYDIHSESKLFSKSYNEVPSGYEMQKNISVWYNKSGLIDKITSSALQSEIYDIIKVDYFNNDLQQMRDSLKMECLKEVQNKVEAYNKLGIKTDTMDKMVSDNFFTIYPQSRYASYQAFTRPSLNVAKKKSVNEVLKITSQYYRQQDYDQYDIVINPVITEPVIQLSYSIIVRYSRDNKEKIYNIITPSGEVKQLLLK